MNFVAFASQTGNLKTLNEIVSLRKSFSFCRDVAKTANANFSYAATLLPTKKREFFYASYAAMRIIDDIVDDEFLALDEHNRQTSREEYLSILKNWLKQVCSLNDATEGPLDIRVITALKHTVGKSDMGSDQWKDLARSLQLDILECSMVSWSDFINYCEGATVSPASIYIYISGSSYEPSDGYKYNLKKSPRYFAKNLAIYCYIVHILRDLAKDAKGSMRLITIPDEVLKEVKLTRSSIQKEVISKSKKISNLADLLSEKAKSYQGKGHSEIEELYPVLGNREALALRGLIGVYDKLFSVACKKSTEFVISGPEIEKKIRSDFLGLKN